VKREWLNLTGNSSGNHRKTKILLPSKFGTKRRD
jgi:hypothetical protein